MGKDIITRFKLETTAFDSAIKKASKELSDYSKTATKAKEGFNEFTKSNVDAARALGTMATSSTNTKQKLQELVGAYNECVKAYKALSDEHKKSDWAQALAGSLTQLQQRIKETKQEMQSMSDASGKMGGGGLLSGDKLSGMLQVFGGNLMTKVVGMLTGMASEIGDLINQGVQLAKQGEGVRIAFERLGRGDILDGLREATHGTVTDIELMKAAVKFNDFKLPVEELGTMLAFAQQKAKDTGQSVDYMVDSIVTGLGRKSLMILDNLGLSATEIRNKMKETGDMTKAVGAIIREQMAAAGDYVETAADRAAQANVSLQNKMEELGRKFVPIEEASNQLWTSMKIGILDVIGGPLATLLNSLTDAGRQINTLNRMQGGGKGKPTRTEREIGQFRNSTNQNATYNNIRANYDFDIISRRAALKRNEQDYKDNLKAAGRDTMAQRGALEQYNTTKTRLEREITSLETMKADVTATMKEMMKPVEVNVGTNKAIKGISDLKTGGTDPVKQAREKVKNAQHEYAQSIEAAKMALDNGTIKEADYKKQLLDAEKRLWDALGDAYYVHADPKYKQAQDECAANIKRLGGEVTASVEAQKQAQEAARQLAQTQKKVNDALEESARAYNNNDLKGYLAAQKKIGGDAGVGMTSAAFSYTGGNLDAFIGSLKEKISTADLGSDLYNNLTKQLADATALGNLMQEAIKQGIDITLFNPQELWQKVFGDNPGDYIDDKKWEEIRKKLEEIIGKPLKLDLKTGNVKTKKKKGDDDDEKSAVEVMGKINSGISSIVTGIEGLGIELPQGMREMVSGISSVLSVLQGITILVEGIASVQQIGTFLGIFNRGGIVPHAANGYFVPGNHYSGDVTPILANAGELVLSRSQQGNLAAQLEGNKGGNISAQPYVSGENIYLGVSNHLRRSGQGEIVTTSMLRRMGLM